LALTKAVMSAPHSHGNPQSASRNFDEPNESFNDRTPIELRFPGRASTCQSFTLVTESAERCLRFLEFLGTSLSEFHGVAAIRLLKILSAEKYRHLYRGFAF